MVILVMFQRHTRKSIDTHYRWNSMITNAKPSIWKNKSTQKGGNWRKKGRNQRKIRKKFWVDKKEEFICFYLPFFPFSILVGLCSIERGYSLNSIAKTCQNKQMQTRSSFQLGTVVTQQSNAIKSNTRFFIKMWPKP